MHGLLHANCRGLNFRLILQFSRITAYVVELKTDWLIEYVCFVISYVLFVHILL